MCPGRKIKMRVQASEKCPLRCERAEKMKKDRKDMPEKNNIPAGSLKEVMSELHGIREAYYARWYHDKPIAITPARRDELRELHRILYKCIAFMAGNYREYVPEFMPLSDREMEILELQSRTSFHAGTFRPDYLVSESGDLLLCEITSRFFGHGIFMSYFSERVADRFMERFADSKKPGTEADPGRFAINIITEENADSCGSVQDKNPGPEADQDVSPGCKNPGAEADQGVSPGCKNPGPEADVNRFAVDRTSEEKAADRSEDLLTIPGEPRNADQLKNRRFRETRYEALLGYMLEITGEKNEIFVLRSSDKTNEIGMYVPFYEYFGKHTEVLKAEEVEKNTDRWRKGFVISALNQKDLLSFSKETIEAMIDAGMYNDLRTVLLIHDKRFMNLWFQDSFTGRCLTPQETEFLRGHAIPTYTFGHGCGGDDPAAVWEEARLYKDGFILKHHRLGKSEKVYAGPLTEPEVWQSLWETGEVREMVLQPFIRQRRYNTVWEGTPFGDYICGMMLCVDDRYYDSGLFRASSLPVTNIGDDRKVCLICTDDPEILRLADVL